MRRHFLTRSPFPASLPTRAIHAQYLAFTFEWSFHGVKVIWSLAHSLKKMYEMEYRDLLQIVWPLSKCVLLFLWGNSYATGHKKMLNFIGLFAMNEFITFTSPDMPTNGVGLLQSEATISSAIPIKDGRRWRSVMTRTWLPLCHACHPGNNHMFPYTFRTARVHTIHHVVGT